jgi:hypothetical protein
MDPVTTKKRRRDRRLTHPQPMRLTARDVEIVEAVHQYRVLRQDQIQGLFFSTKNAAQRALARLYDHGFLERKFLPVLYGRSPTLYVLDKRGADLLRSKHGYEDLNWYASSKALKTDFIEHTTALNDFRVSVVVAARRRGLKLTTWASESQLKADYDRVRIAEVRQPVSVIPDGYFVLDTPRGEAHFFVEVDRGTETLQRFKQKVSAYIAYHESGGYERRYGTRSLRILTIATGEGRLANLRTATRPGVEGTRGRQRFWFALASDLTPATVLSEPVWYLAEEDAPRALVA